MTHEAMPQLQAAALDLEQGRFAHCYARLRGVLHQDPRQREAMRLMSRLAARLDQTTMASLWSARAAGTDPKRAAVAGSSAAPQPLPDRFVLIKPWTAGFFSEVDHVLGWTLVARLTRRRPIVHWGEGFLFTDDSTKDCFPEFFAPLSSETLESLRARSYSFFPQQWTEDSLAREDLHKLERPPEACSFLHFLNRSENVLVADYFCRPAEVSSWIPPGDALHGLSPERLCRACIREYLTPAPRIAQEAAAFAKARLAGAPFIAVHARGSDKFEEDPELPLKIGEIDRMMKEVGKGLDSPRVFLLTDSHQILDHFRGTWGDRLVFTDSARTSTGKGVHFMEHASRLKLGTEVLVDAIIATHAHAFVGIGSSNVSGFIYHARDWPPGRAVCIGPVMQHSDIPAWA